MIFLAWPAWLLFASGTASLVYQVLWIKQLSLVVGVDVYAVTIGVSAFFAGLALGGWWFGRKADAGTRPLRFYALLELAVAVLGVAATLWLGMAAAPFAALEESVGLAAWALPLISVGLPAVLMGGTLPVLMRAVQPAEGQVGNAGGGLYAANTGGAIVGTLLAAFCLIPWLGVRGSAMAAAALNLLAAALAWWLDSRSSERPPLAEQDAALPPRTSRARLALALYAVAGGIALGYEVVWSQTIVQFISTRSFAFAIVLATYLLGLVLGTALVSRRADRLRDPWGVFALLIAGAGVIALLEVVVLGNWLTIWQGIAAQAAMGATGNLLAAMSARFAVAALFIVFVPTLLLGAAFPIALRLGVDASHVGRDVGAVVALNTIGGIVGTALAGFVLVPSLGLVRALVVLAISACVVGLVAVMAGSQVRVVTRWAVAALAGVAVVAGVFAQPDRLAQLLTGSRGGEIAFYEESRGGTVAVVEQRMGQNRFKRLYIQGVSNSGDAMTSLRYMRLQALLPLIVHKGEPRSALVIGLGTGITGGALLAYPTLEHRVIAELLPAVVRGASQFSGNYNVTKDARMDIRVHDGRRELLRSESKYDLVTLEPPPPSAAGVVNLYSSDFYRLAASRLNRDGLVAQWLPLPTQNDEDTRSLVQSFLDVFPYATLWTTELHEMMLVGSMQPIELDVPRIEARFNQPAVASALKEVGVNSPAALMATWVMGRESLVRFAGKVPPVTDDSPRIEYATWVRRADFPVVLSALLEARSEAPLQGASDAFKAELTKERQQLYRFYSAGLYAYEDDRENWARDLRQVMRDDPTNPYYLWFSGGSPRP